MKYDKNNIFAKIIRGEIRSDKVYEDEFILAIKDINPAAKIHILILPKAEFVNFSDFIQNSNKDNVYDFFNKIEIIAKNYLGISEYKLITNNGKSSGQEVMHLHFHLLAN
jgi:histidine triad (HIT) family protein